ncbi:MAG: EMC3/TMCO1 family protein, partial [Nanoarchaeota archaeon]
MDKKGSFVPIFIVMAASIAIASLWNVVPQIGKAIHFVLDPILGNLLDLNVTFGMLGITLVITLITTLIQKYGTDQETMRSLKAEQKKLSEDMKQYKNQPDKIMELNKKQFEFMGEMMKHSMRPIIYTGIPLVLLFRWFVDYFAKIPDFRFFGFLTWLWMYLIFSIIFSTILRKILKV